MFSRLTILLLSAVITSPALRAMDNVPMEAEKTKEKRVITLPQLGKFSDALVNYYIKECVESCASPTELETEDSSPKSAIYMRQSISNKKLPDGHALLETCLRSYKCDHLDGKHDNKHSEPLRHKILRVQVKKGDMLDTNTSYLELITGLTAKTNGEKAFWEKRFLTRTNMPVALLEKLIRQKIKEARQQQETRCTFCQQKPS